jgi:pimeloyl-ACP methyl ester carboxylesterase
MIAQHLALDHANRVRTLVLACTSSGGEHHVTPPLEDVAAFVAAASEPDMAKAVRMRFPMNYSEAFVAREADAIIARAQRDAHLRNDAGTAGQLVAVNGHDTWDRLPQIGAPTLVLHGSDDGIVPLENARNLAARIPGARLKVYDGARHVFFIERAAEFNRDVSDWAADGSEVGRSRLEAGTQSPASSVQPPASPSEQQSRATIRAQGDHEHDHREDQRH